jgi:hypothetical protein
MLWLAAAAVAASTSAPPSGPAPVTVEATATVRIVSGVRLRLDALRNVGAPPAHQTLVVIEGNPRIARLIEFE